MSILLVALFEESYLGVCTYYLSYFTSFSLYCSIEHTAADAAVIIIIIIIIIMHTYLT